MVQIAKEHARSVSTKKEPVFTREISTVFCLFSRDVKDWPLT